MASEPITITNLNDARVDVYRNVRDADLRGRDDLFMSESELVLRRLLCTPGRVHSVLLSPRKHERLREALGVLPATTPVYVAELPLIHEIAAFHVHRGVLAAGYRLPPEQLTLDAALGHLKAPHRAHMTLLLAEGVTNVDNMGALFRNAAAFGVDGIVLDGTCCDPLYRKAIRVSMGHTLAIPYAVEENWISAIERLKHEWGVMVIGAERHDSARPLREIPGAQRMAIVFGSEGTGLSAPTIEICDALCEIPMAEGVPSLNVAVASAVFLYELRRAAATSTA